jgi:hypothetical protein
MNEKMKSPYNSNVCVRQEAKNAISCINELYQIQKEIYNLKSFATNWDGESIKWTQKMIEKKCGNIMAYLGNKLRQTGYDCELDNLSITDTPHFKIK